MTSAASPLRFGSRQALLAGFGGLLLLMALAGAYGLVVLRNLRTSSTQVRQRFLTRSASLEKIRAGIFLSGTYARDYLLAPEASGAEAQRAKLEGLHRETDSALE